MRLSLFAALICASAAAQQADSETPASDPDTAAAPTAEASDPGSEAAALVLEAEEAGPQAVPTTRLEAIIEFRSLLEQEHFVEAAAAGQTMLDLTIDEFGDASREAAVAHNDLAEAERRAQLFDDAEVHYLRSIEIYRALDGPFAPGVIEPTIGLGDNYQDDDQHLNAVSAYNEARNIQRRSYGLLSEEQILVMDRLTKSFEAMRMSTEANEQQLAALALVERNHPAGSLEVLEGIYKYARWLRSASRFFDERAQYERAIRIIRNDYGKEHPLLVTPYREIGNSFRTQAFEDPRGAGALNTALDIIAMQPTIDPLIVAETRRDVGDWRTAFGGPEAGRSDYERAWQLLEDVSGGAALRMAWFGGRQPRFVLLEPLSPRDLTDDPLNDDAVDGHVLLQFDIDTSGRSENVTIIESEPVGFKDEAAVRAIRQSRFRPQIVDGVIVPTMGVAIQIRFRYVPQNGA